jgi:hypothetical protein
MEPEDGSKYNIAPFIQEYININIKSKSGIEEVLS